MPIQCHLLPGAGQLIIAPLDGARCGQLNRQNGGNTSTGLKIYGEGEWKRRQHGVSKRRTWRKMHLGVDQATGEVLAVVTTERDVGDCEVLRQLLPAITEPIEQVSADGAYDTIGCHQAIARRQARAAIPPRENAVITDIGQRKSLFSAQRYVELCNKAIGRHLLSRDNMQDGIMSK